MLINAWRMYLSQLGRTANGFSRISRSLTRMKARRRPLSRAGRIQSLEDRTLLSSTPVISIVADINDKAVSSSSGGWVSIGSYTYFAHDDGIHGNELWRTDGTLAGTSLVADIVPGSESSNIQNLTDVGGALYFRAEDPIHGSELWKSDGTGAGTQLIKDIAPGALHGLPSNFKAVGSRLYFTANDGNGRQLWTTDGTFAGTIQISNVPVDPFSPDSMSISMEGLGSTLFYTANDGLHGQELWVTDGTPAGTQMLEIKPGAAGSNPFGMIPFNGLIYFVADDGTVGAELWASDGTLGGTSLVKDVRSGSSGGSIGSFTIAGSNLFFIADDGTTGSEIYKTDGTTAGTGIVSDLRVGVTGSSPKFLTPVGSKIFFTADNGSTGAEVFVSDGTAAGTGVTRDIRAGLSSSTPANLRSVNGSLFFTATDTISGTELWISDGTLAGTHVVTEIVASSGSSNPAPVTVIGSNLYFTANDVTNGTELWVTDGTAPGTVRLTDVGPGNNAITTINPTDLNGNLVLVAFETNAGPKPGLWYSDGTVAGTNRLMDVAIPTTDGSIPQLLTSFAGNLVFSAADRTTGRELWITNETTGVTTRLTDIMSGFTGSISTEQPVVSGSYLYFTATDSASGTELWKTDGSVAGTSMVADIVAGSGSSGPTRLTDVNGRIFFSAFHPSTGRELWTSDGTAAGTLITRDLLVGTGSSDPQELVNYNGRLIFTASVASFGRELHTSNGTSAGTFIIKDLFPGSSSSNPTGLTVFNNIVFFSATDANGSELWKSDGSSGGTFMVSNINTGSASSSPTQFTPFGSNIYFTAITSTGGTELWKSDGKAAGTVQVADITPGAGSSIINYLKVSGGFLYFSADDGSQGSELWRTDGTAAGTVLYGNFASGPDSYSPQNLTNFNDRLFLTLQHPVLGLEIFTTDGSLDGTSPIRDLSPWGGWSSASSFVVVDDTLYFMANNGLTGLELWKLVLQTNEAPHLDNSGSPQFLVYDEDNLTNQGTTIQQLIASMSPTGGISDNDPNAFSGIAVTNYDDTHGDWEFSLNNGNTWFAFGSLTETNALLLPSGPNTRIRFLPELNFNGPISASLAFRAWDRTSGLSGSTSDVSINGSDTPYSADSETAAIFVNPVNDTPYDIQLSNASINEGIPSNSVIGLLTTSDVDVANSFTYSLLDVGLVPFVISGNQLRSAVSFDHELISSFKVRIRTTDQGGLFHDETFVVTIGDTNDAPILTPSGTAILDSILVNVDDMDNPGTLVSEIIDRMGPGGGISDPDSGSPQGIAVNGVTGAASGMWQFTTDGGSTWQSLGTVNNDSARLLASNPMTRIRFVPNHGFRGTVKIAFVAWDQSTGTNGGTGVTKFRIGSSPFSLAYDLASLTVVNSAPVLDTSGNPTFDPILTNLPPENNAGTLVADLIYRMGPSGGITDADAGAKFGIAINGATNGANGTWEYSLDDGSSWNPVGPAGNASARLLAADGMTRIRFLPNFGFRGIAKIAFVAWDQTAGMNGGTLPVGTRGGNTPYSVAYEYASISVTNSAPVLNASGIPELDSIPAGISTSLNTGTLVTDLIARMGPSGEITDADPFAQQGIAINGLTGMDKGTWEFTINGGTNWTPIGTTGNSDARLLAADANTRVRFVPNQGFVGQVKLAFVGWDRTTGANGGIWNVSSRGGTSAFSLVYDYAAITVTNFAPVLTPSNSSYLDSISNAILDIDNVGTSIEDLISRMGPGGGITDMDPDALAGIAVVGMTETVHGTWEYTTDGGTSWSNLAATGSINARLLAADGSTRIRYRPNVGFVGTPKIAFVAWDRSNLLNGSLVNAGLRGGLTPFSIVWDYASIAVT